MRKVLSPQKGHLYKIIQKPERSAVEAQSLAIKSVLRPNLDISDFVNLREKYKQVYYEAFDRVIVCIREIFEQKDYQVYAKMQEILLSAVHKQECSEDAVDYIHSFYRDDFCKALLKDQLRLLPTMATDHDYNLPNMTIADLIRFIQSLSAAERHFLSEVAILTKLMLLAPATNAVCESSFSSLKRLY